MGWPMDFWISLGLRFQASLKGVYTLHRTDVEVFCGTYP